MDNTSVPVHSQHTKAFTDKVLPTFDVHNASTGEVCAKVAASPAEHAEFALSQTEAVYQHRARWLSLDKRIEILEKLVNLMEKRQPELAATIALEGGKPLKDAIVEADRATQGIKKCIETLSSEAGYVVPMGMYANSRQRMAFTQKEPIGVVLAISAFNHPLNLIVHQVGAAIASGCPCIVKPAGDTPLSCLSFCGMLLEAGLPQQYLHVIATNDIQVASLLVKDPRIALLTFIGSAKVGWMLKNQVADGVRCTLEHGGVAPVIVSTLR